MNSITHQEPQSIRKTFNMRPVIGTSIIALSLLAGMAIASMPASAAQSTLPSTTTQDGQACKITGDGLNKGKSGTYRTDDEGHVWCEGADWGVDCSITTACSPAAHNGAGGVYRPMPSVYVGRIQTSRSTLGTAPVATAPAKPTPVFGGHANAFKYPTMRYGVLEVRR